MVEDTPFVWRSVITDGVAWAALGIAAFGLFVTVANDYLISEAAYNPWYNLQGAVAFNTAVAELWQVYLAVFSPFFPGKLFLLIPPFDVYALTYFSLLLVSLGVLTRRRGLRAVLMRCSLVGSSILLLFEVGLTLVSPGFLSMHVANIQVQWGVAWFSNLDLFEVSAALTTILLIARIASRRSRPFFSG